MSRDLDQIYWVTQFLEVGFRALESCLDLVILILLSVVTRLYFAVSIASALRTQYPVDHDLSTPDTSLNTPFVEPRKTKIEGKNAKPNFENVQTDLN